MKDKEKQEEKEKEYLPFEPFYSKSDNYVEGMAHRLFDDTPEQISHGLAPWDEYSWSRDGWTI